MKRLTTRQCRYRAVAGVFHWASKRHFNLWFTGKDIAQYKPTNEVLPQLVKMGLLKETWRNGRKAYSVSHSIQHLEHGLACTEGVIRVTACDPNCTVVSENDLKQHKPGVIPEWARIDKNNVMLAYEHCTKDNATRSGLVYRKVNAYKRYLENIVKAYEVKKAEVLFVIDLDREAVKEIAVRSNSCYWFTDYQTFLSVPMRHQLQANIYIYGGDGKCYPLKKND